MVFKTFRGLGQALDFLALRVGALRGALDLLLQCSGILAKQHKYKGKPMVGISFCQHPGECRAPWAVRWGVCVVGCDRAAPAAPDEPRARRATPRHGGGGQVEAAIRPPSTGAWGGAVAFSDAVCGCGPPPAPATAPRPIGPY